MMLTMMQAYALEHLKSQGYNYKEVANLLKNNDEIHDEKQEQTANLRSLFEQGDAILEEAFNGHYKVSFVTINGLKNILAMRFKVTADMYRSESNGLFDLYVKPVVEHEIASFLSTNWTVERDGEKISIYVKGKRV